MNNCKWAVIETCQASKFEPEFKHTIAVFERPMNAENFINRCIPAENRDKFEIKHITEN